MTERSALLRAERCAIQRYNPGFEQNTLRNLRLNEKNLEPCLSSNEVVHATIFRALALAGMSISGVKSQGSDRRLSIHRTSFFPRILPSANINNIMRSKTCGESPSAHNILVRQSPCPHNNVAEALHEVCRPRHSPDAIASRTSQGWRFH